MNARLSQNNTKDLFSAELSDIKTIYNVLKCMPHNVEFVIFRPMEEGLKLTINDSKSSEISVYIPLDIFLSYNLNSQDLILKINFKIFTDFLHIFSDEGSPSLKLCFKQYGSPLYLVLKHSDEAITVDCELSTLNADDFTEANLSDECSENSVIFNGEQFVKVLNNLETHSDDFTLQISQSYPYFEIIANSHVGDSRVNISKHSPMVAIFDCKSDFKATYNFSHLKHILKVMNMANKISMSTGPSGLLGINLIIKYDDRQLYVEHFFTSQFND